MEAPLFQSQRLHYRTVEDTDADLNFLYCIAYTVDGFADSNLPILEPGNKEKARQWKRHIGAQSILCVIAYLAPGPTPSHASNPGLATATTPTPGAPLHPPTFQPGTPIGIIVLSATSHALHRAGAIYLSVRPSHRRQGYDSEMIRRLLQYGFVTKGLHRIGIKCLSYDEGEGSLYGRLGFVLERKNRDAAWSDRKWSNILCFSMLEHEWRERAFAGGGSTMQVMEPWRGEVGSSFDAVL